MRLQISVTFVRLSECVLYSAGSRPTASNHYPGRRAYCLVVKCFPGRHVPETTNFENLDHQISRIHRPSNVFALSVRTCPDDLPFADE